MRSFGSHRGNPALRIMIEQAARRRLWASLGPERPGAGSAGSGGARWTREFFTALAAFKNEYGHTNVPCVVRRNTLAFAWDRRPGSGTNGSLLRLIILLRSASLAFAVGHERRAVEHRVGHLCRALLDWAIELVPDLPQRFSHAHLDLQTG